MFSIIKLSLAQSQSDSSKLYFKAKRSLFSKKTKYKKVKFGNSSISLVLDENEYQYVKIWPSFKPKYIDIKGELIVKGKKVYLKNYFRSEKKYFSGDKNDKTKKMHLKKDVIHEWKFLFFYSRKVFVPASYFTQSDQSL